MTKKIAVIGAGIAGLTFANLLKKNGKNDFTVYEKNTDLNLDSGYGVQLAPNSVGILNNINFKKINQMQIFNPDKVDFYSVKAEKICDFNLNFFNKNDRKYTTLQRSTLIEFLTKEIYSKHLKFGKTINEVQELKGKILLKFADNTNDLVDYVVVADGIFSSTKYLFESRVVKPIFKNAIVIRSILNPNKKFNINKENISLFMGPNTHIVIYPINKKEELNMVCTVRSKNPDDTQIRNLIENNLLSQNKDFTKLFDGQMKSWPLYSSDKFKSSKNKKVFYIGDAFNSFLPTLAQGANQSIESAYELFKLISASNDDIYNNYYKNRVKRAKIIKNRSNLNFQVFHIKNEILVKLRNFLIRLLFKKKLFLNYFLGKVYKN